MKEENVKKVVELTAQTLFEEHSRSQEKSKIGEEANSKMTTCRCVFLWIGAAFIMFTSIINIVSSDSKIINSWVLSGFIHCDICCDYFRMSPYRFQSHESN